MSTTNGEEETASVLVVEDEPDIASALELVFSKAGFSVSVAHRGEEAIERLDRGPVELLMLDLNLPDMSGLDILKHLKRSRAATKTRVIILTARKDEVDRIVGFELGADDYVNKPFSPRELVLRARAVLRRQPATNGDSAPQRLSAGPIEIDLEFHEATVEGESLQLTLTEFKLLAELVRAGGRVRSREALLNDVWEYDRDVLSRTVDTHIRRLRSKLGPAGAWLDTVRGVGYRIHNPLAGA